MVYQALTESNGWVTGFTHHHSPNQNGGMPVPGNVLGVVMHTMVGDLPGTDSVFMNPSYQASAHFGIAQDGECIQWVNVRGGVAWHCMAGNFTHYGIEHADNGYPGNPLTDSQLSRSAQIVELLSRDSVGRFPLQVTDSTSGEGYGVHYMGGAAWGGHSCPQLANGTGPRARQRTEILRRAQVIRYHGEYPYGPPPPSWYRHQAGTPNIPSGTTLDGWADRHGTTVSAIIALTQASGTPISAAHLAEFNGYITVGWASPMPAGLVFYAPTP